MKFLWWGKKQEIAASIRTKPNTPERKVEIQQIADDIYRESTKNLPDWMWEQGCVAPPIQYFEEGEIKYE